MTATGTIYALVDPRDSETRYVGQTKRPLSVRVRGKYGRRVLAWMAELRAAGLVPLPVAIRENVPADDLLAAEADEITRIIVAGGTLLNEQVTARGRELIEQRQAAERAAAQRAAWRELADSAVVMFGGPLLPGELSAGSLEDRSPWREVRWLGGNRFSDDMERNFAVARSVHPALVVWYMTAVHPWRHLAELAGLADDDESFIAWAGRHVRVRRALRLLAGCGEGELAKLLPRWYSQWERGPGHLLGVVTAAYSETAPEAICLDLEIVLGDLADDHMLTRPMADLLMRLKPRALDAIFGKDIAAEVDRDFGLAPDTSGRVLRAIVERIGHITDPKVRRAADRSAQTLPVAALPDYRGWDGPSVLAARIVSASLVRAGVAQPDDMTTKKYLANVHALWAPPLRTAEAA